MANISDLNFDNRNIEPTSFEALPAGDYLVVATESERKRTKDGEGERLAFTFEVLDGPAKGRKLFPGFNIVNKNPQAVQISLGELSAFSKACGINGGITDTAQLHNVPFCVTLGVRKNRETGDLENVIKKYKPRTEYKGPAAQGTQSRQPANNQAGAAQPGGAPWGPR